MYLVAFWAVMIPLKILEVFEHSIPQWFNVILGILIFLVYLPFAAYTAYHLVKDLNKTDHKFIPLLERLKGNRSPKEN